MINETDVVHEHHHPTSSYKRICWSAIFVGALVAVGLSFLLNLFAVAIGLSAYTTNNAEPETIGVGGLIGIVIATIASMVAAGYAAGYLGRMYSPKRNHGILYGFTTWVVALLLSAAVAAHMTQYATTYLNAISGHALSVGKNVSTANTAVDTTKATNEVNQSIASVTPSAETLAYGSFILFALFFIGAVSACVGACWAMTCRRDD